MVCSEESDCWNDYLVLRPEEASFLDLFRLLYFSIDQLRERRFIEWPEKKGERRQRDSKNRWLIFISLLAQVVLLLLKKPMAKFSSFLEFCLNLLSSNGGIVHLLLNLLKGNVVQPDKSSSTFASVIGHLDDRLELDKSIKVSDRRRYGAALAMMASKVSYENPAFIESVVTDHWQMSFLGSYDFWNDYQEQPSTQAFMFNDKNADPELILIAFRGTSPLDADDWRVDVDLSYYELAGIGKIHAGFTKALGNPKGAAWPREIPGGGGDKQVAYYTLREKLREIARVTPAARFIVTGHSLGAALAILFAGVLAIHDEAEILERMEGVYTFGQPRVGDQEFGDFVEEKLREHGVSYLRYVYCNDVVPRIPFDDQTTMFKHFGKCLFFNSCYKAKVTMEEPNKNYFSVWWAIPKRINAVWELIRSFILPYKEGPDYREGWFQKSYRVMGLVLPGLADHGPQDYVNATRLGSLPPNL